MRGPEIVYLNGKTTCAIRPPELSEGTAARSNRCCRPLTKSGLDLAIEVQGPCVSPAEQAPDVVCCILAAPVRRRFAGSLNHASSLDPGPVLRDLSRRSVRDREPWPCLISPSVARKRLWRMPGQRAGPTRLKSGLPGFRAAVSLGLIKLAPIAGSGNRTTIAGCGAFGGQDG